MSDRVATAAVEIREQLQELYQVAEDGAQQNRIRSAICTLETVAEVDREKHGATPEDELAALIESTDECLHCGTPIEKGGWCGLEHMRAYFDDQTGEAA